MEKKEKRECCDSDAWWHDRCIAVKILIVIGFVILGTAFLAFVGWVVMALWNWLMPDIFGLKKIGYWQAWGLLALSFILFKGIGGGKNGGHSDRKRRRRLKRFMEEGQSSNENNPSESLG